MAELYPVKTDYRQSYFHRQIITTLQKGGLLWGYKPPILASVSRRWLSLCSSHTGFVAFATSQEVFLSLS
ncbi:hypothetical protein, partial [Tetragenococcus halophilus]|uniref:hypothetical protein n=1 Tax=Tetragenococcus halophilus TaxID=51669 RepID=UPI001F3FF699